MMIIVDAKSDEYQKHIDAANEGCDICPCCGSSRTYLKKKNRVWAGIIDFIVCRQYIMANLYACRECDSEWESDLYYGDRIDYFRMKDRKNFRTKLDKYQEKRRKKLHGNRKTK